MRLNRKRISQGGRATELLARSPPFLISIYTRLRYLCYSHRTTRQIHHVPRKQLDDMQNAPNVRNAAPGTIEAAEALASLVILGPGRQHVPPRHTSIRVPSDHTEIHSIFTPGRLRGKMDYEATGATLAQDNLAKFLDSIQQDPGRADVVQSIKLDQRYDYFLNPGLVELFNQEIWPTYALTDDNTDGMYPPLLDAGFYLKGIQRRSAKDPVMSQDSLWPTDLSRLDKRFIATLPISLIAVHVDLFIKLCPKLQVIQLPSHWCPSDSLPFRANLLDRWKVTTTGSWKSRSMSRVTGALSAWERRTVGMLPRSGTGWGWLLKISPRTGEVQYREVCWMRLHLLFPIEFVSFVVDRLDLIPVSFNF